MIYVQYDIQGPKGLGSGRVCRLWSMVMIRVDHDYDNPDHVREGIVGMFLNLFELIGIN